MDKRKQAPNKTLERNIQLAKKKLLTIEAEAALIAAIKAGDISAVKPLIESYEYVILKIICRLGIEEVTFDELVKAGKVGLKRLAEMELNTANEDEYFSSHAPWWIMGAINDYLISKKQKA